jgi:hypothetical protein
MANNIVLNPQQGQLISIASVGNGTATSGNIYSFPMAVYTFTTPGQTQFANNALLGKALTVAGFANPKNNGTFQVMASTANTVTLANANAVAQSGTATASFQTVGFPAQYASKVENLWANQQSEHVTVNANSGDMLVAIAIGLRDFDPFDLLHGTAPYGPDSDQSPVPFNFQLGQIAGLNDYNAAPTISDQANGIPQTIVATSVTSNVLKVTMEAVDNGSVAQVFVAGQSILLQGTKESFLNGQTVIVAASPVPTATTFSAPFSHANYSNADDSGTATPAGNTWVLKASVSIADSDYTGYTVPPPANGVVIPSYKGITNAAPTTLIPSTPYPSSKWNLDGYYPSIYMWTATSVAAGSYRISLNAMFQPGINAPADWAVGSTPIFDGGVNFMVFAIAGAASIAGSSISTTETTSNPATAPASLTVSGGDGGALLSVGLMKSGNVFAAGTDNPATSPPAPIAMGQIGNGMLVGSEAHYIVEFATVAAGTYSPGFANPLGYPILVGSLAIEST